MSRKIILEVVDGNFEAGFSGMIQVIKNPNHLLNSYPFKLPPNSYLIDAYNDWKDAYYDYPVIRSAGIRNHRIILPDNQVSNTPKKDYRQTQINLQEAMCQWLKSHEIRDIKEHILDEINKQESASLIIKTNDPNLQRLPWQIWDLFQRRPQLEVSFFHFT